MEAVGPRHHLNAPINIQAIQGMANPRSMMPGPGGEAMQSMGPGPPPQFIELRHNAPRLPLGPQFLQRGPPPRPRLFIPQQDMAGSYVQQAQMPQGVDPQADGVRDSRMGLQQGGLSMMMPQQNPVSVPHGQLQPQGAPSTPHTPATHPGQQQPPHASTEAQAAPVDPGIDLPEPDLEDQFVPKGLGGATGEGGVEDEDDLALDLDHDKGDDDLGNLDNLETTDPHLDDLLNSDEFDLLAYTDPELDQGDPKDVFSDQLRLVEAEGETPGPSSTSAGLNIKVEVKPKVENTLTNPSGTSGSSATPQTLSSESADTSRVKLEDRGLTSQLQPGQAVVKDEMGEAVSMLLAGTTQSNKSATQTENQPSSLSSVRLGGVPYSLSGQADQLAFPPTHPHPDLEEDPLGLPDVGGQHSPAVDLAKVESSLEASELPLLIQDLLEHEKKELQKQQQQQQQQQLSLHQGGMAGQMHGMPPQQQPNPQGPGQIMLPQHHRPPPQGIMGQPGIGSRPPHLMQQQQQQRLLGAG